LQHHFIVVWNPTCNSFQVGKQLSKALFKEVLGKVLQITVKRCETDLPKVLENFGIFYTELTRAKREIIRS